jgi:hypothetical protein
MAILQPFRCSTRCLEIESRKTPAVSRPGLPTDFKIILMALSAVILVVAIRQLMLAHKRGALLAAVGTEPGIVVTASDVVAGRLELRGRADSLARKVQDLADELGFASTQVVTHFAPCHSADPILLMRRARQVLRAPASVSIEVVDNRMRLSGYAEEDWLAGLDERLFVVLGLDQADVAAIESISARARRLLLVPDSVDMQWRDDTLILSGVAEHAWITGLSERATAAGFDALESSGLEPEPLSSAQYWRERLRLPAQINVNLKDRNLEVSGTAPRH